MRGNARASPEEREMFGDQLKVVLGALLTCSASFFVF